MLYHLGQLLTSYYSVFNVVHYVSFRAISSLLTALVISLLFGNWFIAHSQQFFRSRAREWTPSNHRLKDNMPTMGGIFIIAVVTIAVLLWCNVTDAYVWLFLLCMWGYGLIGFLDDWQKIKNHKGISAAMKFSLQAGLAIAVVGGWLLIKNPSTTLCMPFFKHWRPELGVLMLPWAAFILVGTSNAVNLTDGLDGLALGSLITNFGTFSIICYLGGNTLVSQYLHIPFAGTSELTVIGTVLVGSSLGFLWYNSYPAQIFMGDVGSLALGAALAFMALTSRQEVLLPIAGGLFVLETVSVIAQVVSWRLFKRRIFKMAPIHHHFELLGWQESKITTRFGIITGVLCLVALVTLKIR